MNQPFIKIGPNAWLNLLQVTDIQLVRDHQNQLVLRFYLNSRDNDNEQSSCHTSPDYTAQVAASLALELDEIPEPAPVDPVSDEDIPW